jgi:hypothetical protein
MIRHIVIINFQRNLYEDYFSLLEKTKPILMQIPGITSYKIFPNSSKYISQNVCSFGVEIIFEDKNALEIFMAHPKHYEGRTAVYPYGFPNKQ